MAKKTSLSGFPEWSPAGRIIEQSILDQLRRTFELHGFASLETRAVEPLSELMRKGETSKEVYVISRLQQQSQEARDADLGLHFDLTVPFARYVLENAGQLAFPFRRYQIQKVWRGERPQDGRFREFTQADIDIVGMENLALHHEIDLPLIMIEALNALPIPPVTVMVNNRKIVQGFCRGIGIEHVEDALRAIDKLDKIGQQAVVEEMREHGISADHAHSLLELAQIRGTENISESVRKLGVEDPQLAEGLEELEHLLEETDRRAPGQVVADLKITRGLDYYTGMVYETFLEGHEDLGSICSGGRYDSLASDGRRSYPGVGLSIGVTRLVSRILSNGLVQASRSVPTCVLVAVNSEQTRPTSNAIADQLRSRGIPTEVSPSSAKFGKQIRYADRRGIPFVWFIDDQGQSTVKDIRSGEQITAEADQWQPAEDDLMPTVEWQG
ncbi:MAG: histidine--tRNA ligase [Actinomycetaceae bacterium]|nr:histidine--tRNA ligase [Actinomycetaceae bacterium]